MNFCFSCILDINVNLQRKISKLEEKTESLDAFVREVVARKLDNKKPVRSQCAPTGYHFDNKCLYSQSYEDYAIYTKYVYI